MAGVSFRILGPLEVWTAGTRLSLRGPRQERCLAALLLEPGQLVTFDALVDATWDDPPPTARRQVQDLVSGVRRLLERHCGRTDTIRTHRAGYLLNADTAELDSLQFDHLVDAGRQAAPTDTQGAAALLRSALSLCRGPTLAGIGSRALEPAVARWEELRLTAREDCLELELELNKHDVIVAELTELASAHPLRERPAKLLMRALYAASRAPEALEVYRQLRCRLADDLGIEPSADLQDLHRTILAGGAAGRRDPIRVAAAHGPVPAQLPSDVRTFAGRLSELARLDALAFAENHRATAVVIAALAGTAGIGKTALAIHWGHRVADRFPDGQLYVNLRGFDPGEAAMRPAEAVRGFLDALRVPPGQIPRSFDAQAGLYRSLLADKRMLVVLDNARDEEQVRPLLPGTSGCVVVITSRNQLGGLIAAEGAHSVTVGQLTKAEARQLLAGRLGQAVVDTQEDAVDTIIEACARLPLALSIVAARAATNPDLSLADLADQLRANSLDGFSVGDPAVDLRPVFSWSYDALSPAAAELFRLLGLHPGSEFGVRVAAGLADVPLPRVDAVLAELVRVNMLMRPELNRYAMHDLLRVYAAELVEAHTPRDDRDAALARMLDYYLRSAEAAARLFRPGRAGLELVPSPHEVATETFNGRLDAQAWLVREQSQLIGAVELAADRGFGGHAWQIASTLEDLLDSRGDWDAMLRTQHAALRAANQADDRLGQASAHSGLGHAYCMRRDFDRASTHLQTTLDLYQQAGDRRRQPRAFLHMGILHCYQDRNAEALAWAERGLPFLDDCPPIEQAYLLSALCWFNGIVGNHRQALAYGEQALAIFDAFDDPGFRGNLIEGMAWINGQLGQHKEAVELYEIALQGYRDAQLQLAEAKALVLLGETYEAMDKGDEATEAWLRAVPVLDLLDPPTATALRQRVERTAPPPA